MPTKDEIRKRVWDYMEQHGIAQFPRPVHNRIPNFVGADRAADRLAENNLWEKAKVIKANPDSAQRPARERALTEGKILYMAVPRLRDERCFVEVRPDVAESKRASTIKGAFRYGRNVSLLEMRKVDMILAGSVAVNRDGTRLGKGGGYSDLEYALARTFDVVDESTPVVTTVHPCQIVEEEIPRNVHDEVLDLIVTPRSTIATSGNLAKPQGIYWELLTQDMIEAIPVLRSLSDARGR